MIIHFRGIVKTLPHPIAITRGRGILNLRYYVLGGRFLRAINIGIQFMALLKLVT